MNNELSPPIPMDEFSRLEALDNQSLKAELANALSMTAANLLRLATIVRILEDRGEDLTELRIGMLGYLRRIACGQILPEVVVRFGEFPSLVQRVGNLPLGEQKQLASGEPVKLIVYRDTGVEHRLLDPLKLTGPQVVQVFARDHIRDESEQIAIIESRMANKPKKTIRARKVKADPKRGGLVIGRNFATVEEILEGLAELGGADFDEDIEGEASVLVPLSAAEHRQLKVKAAKSAVGMSGLARRALCAAGLIRGQEEVE